MKRLQNLIIDGNLLKPNAFNIVNSNSKNPAYVYVWKPQSYEKIYFVRNEMELPYVDTYELRAYSRLGTLCGYAFDFYCKNPIIETNFIIAASNYNINFKELVQQNNLLNLKHKLKSCNVYVLPSVATMLTISVNQKIKELLDI